MVKRETQPVGRRVPHAVAISVKWHVHAVVADSGMLVDPTSCLHMLHEDFQQLLLLCDWDRRQVVHDDLRTNNRSGWLSTQQATHDVVEVIAIVLWVEWRILKRSEVWLLIALQVILVARHLKGLLARSERKKHLSRNLGG